MEFIETNVFTDRVTKLLDDDEYRQLQAELIARPKQGDVISGACGLRKLRWGAGGRGKRGGIRVVYYHHESLGRIYLMYVYDKTKQGDLTRQHLRMLSNHVKDGVL